MSQDSCFHPDSSEKNDVLRQCEARSRKRSQNPNLIRPEWCSRFRNNAFHSSAHAPTAPAQSRHPIERPSPDARARTPVCVERSKVRRDGRRVRLRVSREMRRAQNFRQRIGEIRVRREAGRAGARGGQPRAKRGRDHPRGGHSASDARQRATGHHASPGLCRGGGFVQGA